MHLTDGINILSENWVHKWRRPFFLHLLHSQYPLLWVIFACLRDFVSLFCCWQSGWISSKCTASLHHYRGDASSGLDFPNLNSRQWRWLIWCKQNYHKGNHFSFSSLLCNLFLASYYHLDICNTIMRWQVVIEFVIRFC